MSVAKRDEPGVHTAKINSTSIDEVVTCPVCGVNINFSGINLHLDSSCAAAFGQPSQKRPSGRENFYKKPRKWPKSTNDAASCQVHVLDSSEDDDAVILSYVPPTQDADGTTHKSTSISSAEASDLATSVAPEKLEHSFNDDLQSTTYKEAILDWPISLQEKTVGAAAEYFIESQEGEYKLQNIQASSYDSRRSNSRDSSKDSCHDRLLSSHENSAVESAPFDSTDCPDGNSQYITNATELATVKSQQEDCKSIGNTPKLVNEDSPPGLYTFHDFLNQDEEEKLLDFIFGPGEFYLNGSSKTYRVEANQHAPAGYTINLTCTASSRSVRPHDECDICLKKVIFPVIISDKSFCSDFNRESLSDSATTARKDMLSSPKLRRSEGKGYGNSLSKSFQLPVLSHNLYTTHFTGHALAKTWGVITDRRMKCIRNPVLNINMHASDVSKDASPQSKGNLQEFIMPDAFDFIIAKVRKLSELLRKHSMEPHEVPLGDKYVLKDLSASSAMLNSLYSGDENENKRGSNYRTNFPVDSHIFYLLENWKPNECNALVYKKHLGHHLNPHFDDRFFSGEILVTISLQGDCVMTYKKVKEASSKQPAAAVKQAKASSKKEYSQTTLTLFKGGKNSTKALSIKKRPDSSDLVLPSAFANKELKNEYAIFLPRRCVSVVTRQARYDYTHEIKANNILHPSRVSLTFRMSKSSLDGMQWRIKAD